MGGFIAAITSGTAMIIYIVIIISIMISNVKIF